MNIKDLTFFNGGDIMKKFQVIMHASEIYEVEAEDEDEALEIVSCGEIEPIDKEYYDEDEVREIK